MESIGSTQTGNDVRNRLVTELSAEEARQFFLKQESYSTIDLPRYFQFNELIQEVGQVMEGKSLNQLCKGGQSGARPYDRVNYPLLSNKDGRYSWRPLELLHPALYVSLVKGITSPDHWKHICDRFSSFREDSTIECLSLPIETNNENTDKAEQIYQWWQTAEQKSVELSLDFDILLQTDLVDCYADIYTHSIAWALHGKEKAKQARNDLNLLGNVIDKTIQDMHQGQTNGLPQGSVLMDFIAEMVLGYADTELTLLLECLEKNDYQILRYRDDYRIFVNNPKTGEYILKCLTEVMIGLGLKLGPSKTSVSTEVIRSSIKSDKLDWMFRTHRRRNFQDHLLIIHDHSLNHPNSGSVFVAMQDYFRRLQPRDDRAIEVHSPLPLVAILTDIAYRNPRTYPIFAAILSRLFPFVETDQQKAELVGKILRRFSQIPNTGHMEVWLQRICLSFADSTEFSEPLCALVRQKETSLWNNCWISAKDLLGALDTKNVVSLEVLSELEDTVSMEEVALFNRHYDM